MMDGATDGINPLDLQRSDPKGAGAGLLRQGNFAAAAAVLKEAAAITPDDEETFSLLGAALASNGDASPAIDAFKRAAELGPTNPRSHFNLGLAYQAANRLTEARSSLERAVHLNPAYDAARAKLSEVAQRMGGASAMGSSAAPDIQTTNIVGGGDSSMLLSVGSQYTPSFEGTSNIQAGGDASSLASIGQRAIATAAQNAAQAAEQEGHTNISGGSGAGFSLSDVGAGRAPVRETGTTNIGGGATAATAPPSAAPVLRIAPPTSVGPSSVGPSPASSGYTPPQSTAGTYDTPVPMLGMSNAMMQNSSGMQGDIPPEIVRGFNFGAFALTFLWLINMRMNGFAYGLLGFNIAMNFVIRFLDSSKSVPLGVAATLEIGIWVIRFAIGIYFGIVGNRMAWQNRRFDSVEDFRACQRAWMWWGIGLFILGIATVVGLIAIGVGAALVGGSTGGGARRF